MADYSGEMEPWTTHLTDTWISRNPRSPYVWGSSKDWKGWGTEVPRDLLGLLIDGHVAGAKRARKRGQQVKSVKITWTGKRYRLEGGFRFSDEDAIYWLIRNGYLERTNNGLQVLKRF